MSMIFCFIFILFFSRFRLFGADEQSAPPLLCEWNKSGYAVIGDEGAHSRPEMFWINMDKSISRRVGMESHLRDVGILNRRVKGLSLNDIYIPEDIRTNWDRYTAKIMTDEVIPPRSKSKRLRSRGRNYTHVMAGLVGRGNKNKLKEIGCTSSHLEAIRQAVYFNRSSSRYAIITEDDITIPFNIDFEALVASAPTDFGILQLFNSNEESMHSTWMNYIKKGHLWTEVFQKQAAAFWSTCAYLIDREKMKPIIDKVAYARDDWVFIQLVAGIKKPCRPKLTACCVPQNDSSFLFTHQPPCIWAAKGFQADSYLYALTKTYVLSVPLITNSAGGDKSTFHQDHVVSIHQSAFARQREYINEMIEGKQRLPDFATNACSGRLPIARPKPAIAAAAAAAAGGAEGVVAGGASESAPSSSSSPGRTGVFASASSDSIAVGSGGDSGASALAAVNCSRADLTSSMDSTPIYWINWDFGSGAHSSQRQANMRHYLDSVVRWRHQRIPAFHSRQLFVPDDIRDQWDGRECKFHSSLLPIYRRHQDRGTGDSESGGGSEVERELPYLEVSTGIFQGLSAVSTVAASASTRTGRRRRLLQIQMQMQNITAQERFVPIQLQQEVGEQTLPLEVERPGSLPWVTSADALNAAKRLGPNDSRGRMLNNMGHIDTPLRPQLEDLHAPAIISGLCGRGKGQNDMEDLAITLSHLRAIYTAVYHNISASRYALIIEDDVQLVFDIDIPALVDSAPGDFGILRLYTAQLTVLERLWTRFNRDPTGDLWSTLNEKIFDSWSTKAYLINREVIRPVIDEIFQFVRVGTAGARREVSGGGGGGIAGVGIAGATGDPVRAEASSTATTSTQYAFEAKVIAGLTSPCIPHQCCVSSSSISSSGSSSVSFSYTSPCVEVTAGFLAQKYLWKLAPSYALHIPIVTGNLNGILKPEPSNLSSPTNNSYSNSDPVNAGGVTNSGDGGVLASEDMASLKKHRDLIYDLFASSALLPPFLRICNSSVSWI